MSNSNRSSDSDSSSNSIEDIMPPEVAREMLARLAEMHPGKEVVLSSDELSVEYAPELQRIYDALDFEAPLFTSDEVVLAMLLADDDFYDEHANSPLPEALEALQTQCDAEVAKLNAALQLDKPAQVDERLVDIAVRIRAKTASTQPTQQPDGLVRESPEEASSEK